MTDFKYLKNYNKEEINFVTEFKDNETTTFNYSLYRQTKECVQSCNTQEDDEIRYGHVGRQCVLNNDWESKQEYISKANEISEVLGSSIGQITALTAFSIGLCILMMILFRYATAVLIWGTVIGCYTILIVYTLYLWFAGSSVTNYDAIIVSIISVVVTIYLMTMLKRIPLVIGIFKEATKAIFAMPLIVFEPLLTFISFFLAVIMFLITEFYMVTAGVLEKIDDIRYDYISTPAMCFALTFNIIMLFWILKFIMGCQIMVISGAISSYYFARDKTFLGDPIRTSFKNLIHYHLGSAALGSLLLTIADIIKAILHTLEKNRKTQFLVLCCGFLHTLITYISTNAYIQIAMHGENFFRSGRRAIQLIYQNLNDIVAINTLGDFVLFMAKLFIVLCTLFFGMLICGDPKKIGLVLVAAFLISAFLSNCLFRVFETAIDTIFLCYCEDCQINDGDQRPYYMSTELMQLIQESKSVMASKSMEQTSEI